MWLPVGSQVVDPVFWQISALGLGWLSIPRFGSVHRGSQPLIPLRNHPRFQLWAPCRGFRCACQPRRFLSVRPGSRATYPGSRPPGVAGVGPRPMIGVLAHWGTLGLAPRQPGRLSGRVLTPEFQLWAPSPLIWVCASGTSGEFWGCFSRIHSPGAEGVGAPEAAAAAESSLTSYYVPLFSFPF